VADISREDLATIIQEEYSNELLAAAMGSSVCLQAFRRVEMGTKVNNLPVLATIPEADFVAESASDSAGVKPTSAATWGNKQLVAEEIAVIIPVHENAVDDASVDVLDEITRHGGAAIGRKLDGAVIFGDDKPVSWTSDSLYAAAIAAGNEFVIGDAEDGEDLMGSLYLAAQAVEEAGWEPSTVLAPRGMRYRLANSRNTDGTPIFLPSLSTTPGSVDTIAGMTGAWVSGRVWDRDIADAFVVDAERVIIGVRQDISVKFLTEATVGGINLAERDMVALRFKARYAYVLGDNTNSEADADNCPVALVAKTASS
jgi:HK97 family phage major capsid protein